MSAYLEHANVTVPSIDAAIEFLKLVDPDFIIRHDEAAEGTYRWAHVGTHQTYIALQEPHLDAGEQQCSHRQNSTSRHRDRHELQLPNF